MIIYMRKIILEYFDIIREITVPWFGLIWRIHSFGFFKFDYQSIGKNSHKISQIWDERANVNDMIK